MKQSFVKAILTQVLVYLLGAINPEQKAEVDALFTKREAQQQLDDVNKVESAVVEQRVVERDVSIVQNDADRKAALEELQVTLDDIQKTESIEEVWKK